VRAASRSWSARTPRPTRTRHRRFDELTVSFTHVVDTIGKLAHGAFKPVEVPGAVLSDQPKAGRERRNPSATAHEMGADVERLTRVARWRDAAAVREVPPS
jgi:hypothetical protein